MLCILDFVACDYLLYKYIIFSYFIASNMGWGMSWDMSYIRCKVVYNVFQVMVWGMAYVMGIAWVWYELSRDLVWLRVVVWVGVRDGLWVGLRLDSWILYREYLGLRPEDLFYHLLDLNPR